MSTGERVDGCAEHIRAALTDPPNKAATQTSKERSGYNKTGHSLVAWHSTSQRGLLSLGGKGGTLLIRGSSWSLRVTP